MIHPSSSTINRMDTSANKETEASTCEAPKTASSPSSQEEEELREWIRYGISFEWKCLEALSIADTVGKAPILHRKAATSNSGSNISSSKENIAINGHAKKLEIRLPFVDWKTTLTRAKTNQASTNNSDEISKVISNIVQGWLIVLTKLNHHAPVHFSSATSFRSQIYRRLVLLLLGFVGTGKASKEEEGEATTNRSSVTHTSHLARKILKEEGTNMKKKKKQNTNVLDALESPRSIEADGIYYYCVFTAIAAECAECLGDQDKALMAYKSIRAMEDRQKKDNAGGFCSVPTGSSSCGVYSTRTDRMETKRSGTFSNGPNSSGSNSPTITVTKTPTNTPKALARKKSCNGKGRINHATCSSNANHRRNSFFSPRVLALPFHNSVNDDITSKIGNDLVLPGTLEERILRCSLEDCPGPGSE